MAEQPTSPLDRMVDLLVYAPVGLALTAKEELPRLVDRGRRGVASQVLLARFVGRLAVKHGTREAGRFLEQALERIATPGAPAPSDPPSEDDRMPAGSGERTPSTSVNGNGHAPSGERPAPDAPAAHELGIPGYDSLSAPHVVQRLGGLAAAELDAVRRYEEAHRGRRTILSRIAQLQAERI